MTTETETPTVFTEAEQRRLRAALNTLPYGFGAFANPTNVAELVDFLVEFRAVLRRVADDHNFTQTRLDQLDRDVAGMRRLLGLPAFPNATGVTP